MSMTGYGELVERIRVARAARDWPTADAARRELGALGFVVHIERDGNVWLSATPPPLIPKPLSVVIEKLYGGCSCFEEIRARLLGEEARP